MLHSFNTRTVTAGTPEHVAAQQLIGDQYRRHFGADPAAVPREILTLTADSTLVGCVGYAPAAGSRLFLEQYLDSPIEKLLGGTSREAIVEIGGFAVTDRTFALPLMLALARELSESDFVWAVCTVTQPVRGCLRKLGIESHCLAAADPTRLQQEDHDWGTYYKLRPEVHAGSIASGNQAVQRFQSLLQRAA